MASNRIRSWNAQDRRAFAPWTIYSKWSGWIIERQLCITGCPRFKIESATRPGMCYSVDGERLKLLNVTNAMPDTPVQFKYLLGARVRDKHYEDMKGIIVSQRQMITGCNVYDVQQPMDSNTKEDPAVCICETRVVVIEGENFTAMGAKKRENDQRGGPAIFHCDERIMNAIQQPNEKQTNTQHSKLLVAESMICQ